MTISHKFTVTCIKILILIPVNIIIKNVSLFVFKGYISIYLFWKYWWELSFEFPIVKYPSVCLSIRPTVLSSIITDSLFRKSFDITFYDCLSIQQFIYPSVCLSASLFLALCYSCVFLSILYKETFTTLTLLLKYFTGI